MKIGALVFLTDQSGNPGAIAREAENLGFESFFVAEHMVVPSTYTTHYPRSRDGKVPEYYARLIDPFVALAIAADATSRIKIGTAICLLPQRDVIETAKVTASIDLYSKGRLILKLPEDFAEKIVWGSRYPHQDTTSAWDAIEKMTAANIAEATMARMLGGNASQQIGRAHV